VLANLAVLLGILWFPLCYYGVLSQLGDPAPYVSQSDLSAARAVSVGALTAGCALFVGALFLSGYVFVAARWRAVLAFLLCVVPLALVLVGTYV
jgi:hypothetical protein